MIHYISDTYELSACRKRDYDRLPKLTTRVRFPSPAPFKISKLCTEGNEDLRDCGSRRRGSRLEVGSRRNWATVRERVTGCSMTSLRQPSGCQDC
jgi:hypothetical protein